jgi:hypothetical protein
MRPAGTQANENHVIQHSYIQWHPPRKGPENTFIKMKTSRWGCNQKKIRYVNGIDTNVTNSSKMTH